MQAVLTGNILQDTKWHRMYSLFPALGIIWRCPLIWFAPWTEGLTTEEVTEANVQIQALVRSCPNLRVILVGLRAKKAVILRDDEGSGSGVKVRWVVRKWEKSEEPYAKDGERVYGP